MKNNFEQFISNARNVKLTANDQAFLRSRLLEYMENHPVRKSLWSRLFAHGGGTTINFMTGVLRPMPLTILIAVLVGGTTSFAASGSLPGDALYPVKIQVNERVEGFFAVSHEAKIKVESEHALKRLEEAQQLSAQGKLNEEARLQIEASFKSHAEKVRERIELMQEKNPEAAVDVASNFESSIRAHNQVLIKISENPQSTSVAASLLDTITQANNAASAQRVKAEARVNAQPEDSKAVAAQVKLNAAESKIAEVWKYLDVNENRLSTSTKAQANAQLTLAGDLVAQGKAKLEANAYSEAFTLFSQAHRTAQEAKKLLEIQRELKVELNLQGSAEVKGVKAKESSSIGNQQSPASTTTPSTNKQPDDKGRGKLELNLEF